MKNIVVLLALFSFMLISCSEKDNGEWKVRASDPELLHGSIKQVTDVIVHDIFSPPVASRIYAYISVAGYEAARNQDSTYLTLAGQLHGLDPLPKPESGKEYCFPFSSTIAVLKVGRALVFSEDKMDKFYDSLLLTYKNTGMPEDVYDRSLAYGIAVADHIISWSGKDNYKQTRSFPKYSISDDPSTWRPTPPAYMDAVEPHWNKIRTFVIDSAAQFKPARHTPFSTDKKSQFYKEALEVRDTGNALNEEKKNIAMFWDCNPFVMNVKGHVMFATKKISPGGHWINITHVACSKVKADAVKSAEAYAKVAITLADAFISCWDEKYRSKLIRPETYINQYIDQDWIPLLQTPPFPEHTSGHSVASNSAAIALTDLFGDNFSFTDSTEMEFGLGARSFTSFRQAAEEATISRFYGGIHYMPACTIGATEGKELGTFVMTRLQTRKRNLALQK